METVNQEQSNPEKTFTQEEVDRIVGDRLRREREKFADYDSLKAKADQYDGIVEQNKSELQKATERATALEKELTGLKKAEAVRIIREKVATETGVPASFLTGETEEDCKAQAKALDDWKKPSYPNVKDGGEPNISHNATTRQQFAEWFAKLN